MPDLMTKSKWEVREDSKDPARTTAPAATSSLTAHPSIRFVAQLNERWRVVDDPHQWILQMRKGNPRGKNTGWLNRSFCRTREGLLRAIHDHCGEIDPTALAVVEELPSLHY